MDCRSRPVLPRDKRSRNLRGGRCPTSLRQRRDVWRGRRRHGRETRSSVSRSALVMKPPDLQEIRSTPLFATLTDEQLGCLDGGEIIDAPAGTVLAPEGERTG